MSIVPQTPWAKGGVCSQSSGRRAPQLDLEEDEEQKKMDPAVKVLSADALRSGSCGLPTAPLFLEQLAGVL